MKASYHHQQLNTSSLLFGKALAEESMENTVQWWYLRSPWYASWGMALHTHTPQRSPVP